MLKLTSRFVLQVLPYLLMALAAIVLLPGVADTLIAAVLPTAASAPSSEIKTTFKSFSHSETPLDLIRQDHEAFASNRFFREIAKAAEGELEDR